MIMLSSSFNLDKSENIKFLIENCKKLNYFFHSLESTLTTRLIQMKYNVNM